MATDFTQDTLLHFLQSQGGSVKNSDLILHFRNFIRDHADRNRNRELFKKFVNSVAVVRQVDGVSFVFLRKKFKGHVPGGGERGSDDPRPSRLPTGKNAEPSPENAVPSPAGCAAEPLQKPRVREVTTPAPLGVTAEKTILPSAGILLNNNNVATHLNLNQRQVISTPGLPGRPAASAQVVSQISEKPETPSPSDPPAPDQCTQVGQLRVGSGPPPGITPVVAAVGSHGETRQQVPGALGGREACPQPEGGLHQGPPLHHVGLQPQDAPRRFRHRPSYKSAISYDDDDEDEEDKEEVQLRQGSAGGAWPPSNPLGAMGSAISASSPCIVDPHAPPSVVSSSSSSERQIPMIFVQDSETMPPGGPGWSLQSGVEQRGLEPGSVPWESTRRSLPLEAERHIQPAVPRGDVHADRRYSHPAGVQPEPRQGPNHSQGEWLSSSHSSTIYPSSAGLSTSERPQSGSPRGPGWNSSYEDPQARAGVTGGGAQILEAIHRAQGKKLESVPHLTSKTTAPWHHSTGNLHGDQEATARLSAFHRSSDHLHDDRVMQWHLSTGDLHADREESESSDGSTSSPPLLRPRPSAARRLSSRLRSRMCRSLGADLDQILQEEARAGGGSEAARLNRLHLISSSLSLRYDLSSSSLSSCSTPPRCHSLADLDEGMDGRAGRRSSPAAAASSPIAQHEGSSRQSLVPLEPREHAWLVKGAAGAWPDIYTLFREDSSLLNRRDFISGFTVLHWIAKHGDHRVLNTLWYGVQKAGLMFDMNAKSTCGHTPLHIAAIHGHSNVLRLLVNKFSADVKLRDTAGKKPWQYLSRTVPPDVFQMLGAPARPASGGEGGGGEEVPVLEQRQQPRRRRRHHLSFASPGQRPPTMTGTTRVKRSTSIAAFLKHKTLQRFHGHQSDSSV
ncbi:hypothetical protein VZT92_010288 [Zoarces viviparus]|uniref:SOWAHA-C winged helix-turn-helix domain-containing protein n=1 Tax=Zoarces viviparus TaxID=48416 RepID=A0AAW1FE19_ZOAVI